MGRYIIRRLLLTVLVVVCAAFVIFTVMYFVPGDPALMILGGDASPKDLANMRAKLGLDQPYLIQLGKFMSDTFLRLDLGTSWFRDTPVLTGLMDRLPRTFLLGVLSVIFMVVLGVPIGINAAIHRGGVVDRTLITVSMLFISLPEFCLALVLILVFALELGWLPSYGIETWTCYVLPVVAGSLGGVCNIARQTRASVLDVVNADYITTARAKGMKERSVIYKHMLPNALIPIITLAGNYFTRCVGGTIVIEKIFSFPGIGLYLTDAISMRDYPVIRGCVIVLAAFTAILMLLVDLAYAYVDPRIKAQYSDSGKKKGRVENHHRHHRSKGKGRHRHEKMHWMDEQGKRKAYAGKGVKSHDDK